MYLALGHLILFFCVCGLKSSLQWRCHFNNLSMVYFLYHGDSINVSEKAVFLSVNAKSDVIKWQPGASPIIQKTTLLL